MKFLRERSREAKISKALTWLTMSRNEFVHSMKAAFKTNGWKTIKGWSNRLPKQFLTEIWLKKFTPFMQRVRETGSQRIQMTGTSCSTINKFSLPVHICTCWYAFMSSKLQSHNSPHKQWNSLGTLYALIYHLKKEALNKTRQSSAKIIEKLIRLIQLKHILKLIRNCATKDWSSNFTKH